VPQWDARSPNPSLEATLRDSLCDPLPLLLLAKLDRQLDDLAHEAERHLLVLKVQGEPASWRWWSFVVEWDRVLRRR
jgi:hypothetical protein